MLRKIKQCVGILMLQTWLPATWLLEGAELWLGCHWNNFLSPHPQYLGSTQETKGKLSSSSGSKTRIVNHSLLGEMLKGGEDNASPRNNSTGWPGISIMFFPLCSAVTVARKHCSSQKILRCCNKILLSCHIILIDRSDKFRRFKLLFLPFLWMLENC